jgi:hypothetical protein
MKDILDYIGSWSVLQWIVLVLIAAFIGQFGKMAAEAITAKIRARSEKKDVLPAASAKSSAPQPSPISQIDEVPDKKLLKAMAKTKKKESKKKE